VLNRISVFLLLLISGTVVAQDPEFTQFYANPIYLNPAFAGSAHCPRVNLNYRNQWPALTGTFVTSSVSYDQHFDGIGGGLGVIVLSDKAGEGTLTTTNIGMMYSYQLNINREFSIRTALQGTYVQKTVDRDKLTFGDQIDPRYGFIYPTNEFINNTKINFWDFSAGILAYSSQFYGGVAVNHMTQPEEYFIKAASGSKLPMKITGHAGAIISLSNRRSDDTYLSPNVLFQMQRDFQQLNFGLYVSKTPLVAGLWYRNKDSFIALVGLQYGIFKFGYSYDLTVSKLANASAGSHELSFSVQFQCHPRKKRFRAVKCPAF
jgi:type IX secretion system PorP/SprF family membrane protein